MNFDRNMADTLKHRRFRLRHGVVLSLAISSLTSAASFDDQFLRRNAASLAEQPSTPFTASELALLRSAGSGTASQSIFRLLAGRAQIEVTINPEGRVTARRTALFSPTIKCGESAPWLIRINNNGFVTSPISIEVLEGAGTRHLHAAIQQMPLSGARTEFRILQLDVDIPESFDATLRFTTGSGTADLARRAEVSLWLHCDKAHRGIVRLGF